MTALGQQSLLCARHGSTCSMGIKAFNAPHSPRYSLPHFAEREPRHREVKSLAQGHVTRKWFPSHSFLSPWDAMWKLRDSQQNHL